MPVFVSRDDVEQVFKEWRRFQARPESCKLTEERADLITARIRAGYTVDDLRRILRFIFKADADDPRWMRGHNPRRRQYLDLSHIFRKQRMGERSEASAEWEAEGAVDAFTDSNPWVLVEADGT